jgi:RNA polymerase sigma-70 factor (ECF subfamily)
MKELDKGGYEQLFREYYPALCRYATGIIGDPDDSEDIVQQVFVRLWNRRKEMDMNRAVSSYLYTSVRNTCINYIRDNRKFQSQELDIDIHLSEALPDKSDGPVHLYAEELEERIRVALLKLPEKSLVVFQMSRLENKKYKQIAEKLGITVKTVEAHMSRALRILREELRDYLLFLILALPGIGAF